MSENSRYTDSLQMATNLPATASSSKSSDAEEEMGNNTSKHNKQRQSSIKEYFPVDHSQSPPKKDKKEVRNKCVGGQKIMSFKVHYKE